jgi:hypothetical protein
VAGYKDYVLEFKLGDGTMHSISFRIPLGENGGYYTPEINQISETEIEISYVPSMADMPTIKPAAIKIPSSGGNAENGFSPIAKVEQTATGAVISITDKDGTTTATITNGKDGKDGVPGEKGDKGDKGDPGEPGQKGEQGAQGEPGKDGYTPVKGVDYFDGSPGKDGADGKTPVKGVDYYTEADKSEMVNLVLSALPVAEGVLF